MNEDRLCLSLENGLTLGLLIALSERGYDWPLAAIAVWLFVVVVFNVRIKQNARN